MSKPCPNCAGAGKVTEPDDDSPLCEVIADCAECDGTGVSSDDDQN